MSLLDDLESLTESRFPCRFAKLEDELTPDEWEALLAVIASIDTTVTGVAARARPVGWESITRMLRKNGHRITATTIKNHCDPNERCSCGTA